ncbi:MAG: dienelactone hydrolase family protein, partial [Pseudomonadota bacterium]
APTFLLLAGADTVTAPETCQAIAEIQRDRGGIVVEHTYPGVDHGFDQQERAADSQLVFDPETTADAFRRAGAFLEDLTATPEISRR